MTGHLTRTLTRPLTRTVLAHLFAVPLLALPGLWLGPASAADPPGWPLDPRPEVVSGFDPPAEQWGAGHRGVDLLGRPGQAVHAARDGTVTFAGMLAGRGVVVVSHGPTRTTYEPVDASARVGDPVRAGDRIGTLARFGSHCWPRTCLHWGLVEGETYLDPLTLVGAGPVRLLPLFSVLTSTRVQPSTGGQVQDFRRGWLVPRGSASMLWGVDPSLSYTSVAGLQRL